LNVLTIELLTELKLALAHSKCCYRHSLAGLLPARGAAPHRSGSLLRLVLTFQALPQQLSQQLPQQLVPDGSSGYNRALAWDGPGQNPRARRR
jgi:hypothetical protein